ncbi:MAG TPA: hypothetical protein VMF06_19890 [Candidatus Limnocylindria bacterium]|nr:hypothetical protein [Candidatus Limnocylindria bacterium]
MATVTVTAAEAPRIEWGPLWHEFPLTLRLGERAEGPGPFYWQETTPESWLKAFGPFYVRYEQPGAEYSQTEILYPIFSIDRVGPQYRWNVFQLISGSGGRNLDDSGVRRHTVFPIYFQQTSTTGTNDYLAVLPFYGDLRHRLFRDEVHFVMLPFYVRTRKKDVITDNYVAPFFHIRHGGAVGWQFWPLYGQESRLPTTRTNELTDAVEVVPGHEKQFVLWPIWFNDRLGLGTTNVVTNRALLPLYSLSRSPAKDQSTYLWPFFSHTVDRENKFDEWGMPWPVIGWANGEGKHARRFWPVWGKASNAKLQSDFVAWPIYTHQHLVAPPLDREQYRSMFFLYRDVRETDLNSGKSSRWNGLLPLFIHRKDREGRERWQFPALIEPVLPSNSAIDRGWSPFWTLYRSEKNPTVGASSQSLLWNLYRHDRTTNETRTSFFFGMVRTQKTAAGRHWSLFWTGSKLTPPVAKKEEPKPELHHGK